VTVLIDDRLAHDGAIGALQRRDLRLAVGTGLGHGGCKRRLVSIGAHRRHHHDGDDRGSGRCHRPRSSRTHPPASREPCRCARGQIGASLLERHHLGEAAHRCRSGLVELRSNAVPQALGSGRTAPCQQGGNLAVLGNFLAGTWVDEEVFLDGLSFLVGHGVERIGAEQFV
jgi:hypothetical protein